MTFMVPRSDWGARHPAGFGARRLPTSTAWLHHSVTLAPDLEFRDLNRDSTDDDEAAAMRSIEGIGQQRFNGGFSYNLALMPSGRLYEGCGVSRIGAHTARINTTALGLVLVGNYEANPVPSAMRAALPVVLAEAHRRGWIDRPAFDGGHRDRSQTSCPGINAYSQLGAINAEAVGAQPMPAQPHDPSPTRPAGGDDMDRLPVLRRGASGFHVLVLQNLLQANGAGVAADGEFGPGTEAALRTHQAAWKIGADGVAGPVTWGTLLRLG